MACSSACLGEHLETKHPEQAALTAPERARAFAGSINARFPDNWQRFLPHRQRLMELVRAAGVGGRLAVLGAGNASDLELSWLTEHFDEVHLIDVDEPSLQRAKARHALTHPERVVLHGGVDLSGLLDQLEPWAEAFPDPRALGTAAVQAASRLVQALGMFDVTLSTCVLSQLGLPFRRAWVTSRANWAHLSSALTGVHLAMLAGITSRAGVLVCDVQTTQREPGLDDYRSQDAAALQAYVDRRVASGALELGPDPQNLAAFLRAPGLAHLVAEPQLTLPWLWDLGDVRQLVYAVTFRHPSG